MTTSYTYDDFGNLTKGQSPRWPGDHVLSTPRTDAWRRDQRRADRGIALRRATHASGNSRWSGNVVERFVFASGGNAPAYMIKDGATYRLISDERGVCDW